VSWACLDRVMRTESLTDRPQRAKLKMAFQWFNVVLVVIGIYVALDGVASVFVKHGQYHNIWFDGERYVRALAGIVIIALGIVVR